MKTITVLHIKTFGGQGKVCEIGYSCDGREAKAGSGMHQGWRLIRDERENARSPLERRWQMRHV